MRLEVSLAGVDAERAAAAASGFSWECWQTAAAEGDRGAETGGAEASVVAEEAADLGDLAAAAAEAEELREAGSSV